MSYSVVTTILSAAASADLTDLATAKDELSITDASSDAWLTRALAQVSAAIGVYCKRGFAPECVQDAFDIQQDPYPYQTPGGFPSLELTRWPLLGLVSVTQTIALGTPQTLVQDTDFRLDPTNGRLLRLNPFTGVVTLWEALPVSAVYTAGYGALVQESHTVPGTPFQVAVAQASTFSCNQQVSYANGTVLTPVAANPAQGQYSYTPAGLYTFNPADAGQSLSFAYATLSVPDDLVDATLRLVTARFKAKDRDPALIQRDQPGLGTERYWFGGAPGQKGPFPPDVQALLDAYRTPTVA